jgi:hypothetical protein
MPDVHEYTVEPDMCGPAATAGIDSSNAALGRNFPSVPAVFSCLDVPEVRYAIVGRVPIDVIDVTCRPLFVEKKPRNLMSFWEGSEQVSLEISLPHMNLRQCLLARVALIPRIELTVVPEELSVSEEPEKLTGVRLIANELRDDFV